MQNVLLTVRLSLLHLQLQLLGDYQHLQKLQLCILLLEALEFEALSGCQTARNLTEASVCWTYGASTLKQLKKKKST